MSKIVAVAAMVCVGLFTIGVCAQTAASPAEQAIRAQMAKMAKAAQAHDTDGFMTAYLHAPSLVFVINGEVIHGWDALHAEQLKWWHNGTSDAQYASNGAPEFMTLGPDLEIVTMPRSSTRTCPDGKVSTGTFVVTDVWQRRPEGWRIVYGHESWATPPC